MRMKIEVFHLKILIVVWPDGSYHDKIFIAPVYHNENFVMDDSYEIIYDLKN
jgi:hypothetical protein